MTDRDNEVVECIIAANIATRKTIANSGLIAFHSDGGNPLSVPCNDDQENNIVDDDVISCSSIIKRIVLER